MKKNITNDIKKRMNGRQFSDEEIKAWMEEDYTKEYDAIILKRRNERRWKRGAAAAAIIMLFAVAGWNITEKRNVRNSITAMQQSSGINNKVETHDITPLNTEQTVLAHTTSVTTQPKTQEHAVKQEEIINKEEIIKIIAQLEEQTQRIEDSVDIAHIIQHIETDERLYELKKKLTCTNCDIPNNETHYISNQ